jgi:hypothetical protein
MQAHENEGIAIPSSDQKIQHHSRVTLNGTLLVGNFSFLIRLNGSNLKKSREYENLPALPNLNLT